MASSRYTSAGVLSTCSGKAQMRTDCPSNTAQRRSQLLALSPNMLTSQWNVRKPLMLSIEADFMADISDRMATQLTIGKCSDMRGYISTAPLCRCAKSAVPSATCMCELSLMNSGIRTNQLES